MRTRGTFLALGLVLACGAVPKVREGADKIETFFRVTPPALQAAYAAALDACINAHVKDRAAPTLPEVEAAEKCSAEVEQVWAPIWDGLAQVDAGCDLVPVLCRSEAP